ncbi:MAG TPA: ATP-NAD kinase family protein [Clostridia bacterium]|nr:ATP-NAD kinase family protein [Clostridia bacterium]
MKKIGLLINPVAGIGGRVGLKGSDGGEIQKMAKERGAISEAPVKASRLLAALAPYRKEIDLWTAPGIMGENVAVKEGWQVRVIGQLKHDNSTFPADTENIARLMVEAGLDLIVFVGGDGTARDVYAAVGNKTPVLGIPAGVKMHSAVFSISPRQGAQLLQHFLQDQCRLKLSEVMDIDENDFRRGRVSAQLYGFMMVPHYESLVQGKKAGGVAGEKAIIKGIAQDVIDGMENNCLYIIGPGTTTLTVMEHLNLPGTLLGVDVVINKKLLASDVGERELLQLLSKHKGHKGKIVVTPIGGQGYVFGRGNQQISHLVISIVGKENIIIISTNDKILSIPGRILLTDTGDEEVDEMLSGYHPVITGYGQRTYIRLINDSYFLDKTKGDDIYELRTSVYAQ